MKPPHYTVSLLLTLFLSVSVVPAFWAPALEPVHSRLVIRRGNNATLGCIGNNLETWNSFSFWKFNGTDIKNGTNYTMFFKPIPRRKVKLTLHITNVSERNVGQYVCEAISTAMFVNATIQLNLYEEVVKVATSTEQVTVEEGMNTNLVCNATFSKVADVDIFWLFNGELVKHYRHRNRKRNLPLNDRVKTISLPLELKYVSLAQDDGIYTCSANSSVMFSAKNISVRVNGSEGPKLTASDSVVVVKAGDNVTLSCRGFYPNTAFESSFWLLNGSRIQHQDLHSSDEKKYFIKKDWYMKGTGQKKHLTLSMTIFHVVLLDSGTYTCVLNTSHGVWKSKIELLVQQQPAVSPITELLQHALSNEILLYSFISLGLLLGVTAARLIFRQIRKRRKKSTYSLLSKHKSYEYDVFVTYSSKDSWWVNTQLLTLLRTNHVTFCIHHVHWELGMSIFDNMVKSVRESRKVLVVWSAGYASSKYCLLELHYAMQRTVDEGDYSLVVMRLDETKVKRLPKPLRNKTFLDYCHSTEREGWEKRLIKHLKKFPKPQTGTPV